MSEPIVLDEILTIHSIQAQFDELKQSFSQTEESIEIDASKVESIDTSGYQMLLALKRHAEASGKKVEWSAVNDLFLQSGQKLGLEDALQLPA